jgi:hypothetical protein
MSWGHRAAELHLPRSLTMLHTGNFTAEIAVPASRPLQQHETTLARGADSEDRECFLRFMSRMLQWVPEDRSTARELLEDEWIVRHT